MIDRRESRGDVRRLDCVQRGRPGGSVTIPEAACVKTTVKVENGILGVANSFTRFRGTVPASMQIPQKPGFGPAAIPTAIPLSAIAGQKIGTRAL